MRYPKEHAEEIRRKLIREGGRQIKERGVLGAGVDGIARGLGLSGAALYSHFESKEQLLSEILAEELGATSRRFLGGLASVDEILLQYLSLAHARNPARGCALPAITADVSRGSDELRAAFGSAFSEVVDALEQKLGKREDALGMLASLVGAVALARALPGDRAAMEVLGATRRLVSQGLAASPSAAANGGRISKRKAAKKTSRKKRA